MDEKTAELRDLFVDATGSETVTERQAESPGSLVDRDEDAVAERVSELVATMRDRYAFDGRLTEAAAVDPDDPTAAHERVVRGFFADEDDATIAADLGVDAETVRDARFDLHLVAEADRETPFEYAALKRLLAADRSVAACATALDADVDAVRAAVPVARADLASTRANDRFRDGFRDLLTDADIEDDHATTARDDGLREATEDIETDVSL